MLSPPPRLAFDERQGKCRSISRPLTRGGPAAPARSPGGTEPSFYFESLDFPVTDRKMEAFRAEFPARSKPTEPHAHEGAEFVYVLQGQLSIEVGDTTVTLRKGDAMYFNSAAPHSYRHEGASACSVIVVDEARSTVRRSSGDNVIELFAKPSNALFVWAVDFSRRLRRRAEEEAPDRHLEQCEGGERVYRIGA